MVLSFERGTPVEASLPVVSGACERAERVFREEKAEKIDPLLQHSASWRHSEVCCALSLSLSRALSHSLCHCLYLSLSHCYLLALRGPRLRDNPFTQLQYTNRFVFN